MHKNSSNFIIQCFVQLSVLWLGLKFWPFLVRRRSSHLTISNPLFTDELCRIHLHIYIYIHYITLHYIILYYIIYYILYISCFSGVKSCEIIKSQFLMVIYEYGNIAVQRLSPWISHGYPLATERPHRPVLWLVRVHLLEDSGQTGAWLWIFGMVHQRKTLMVWQWKWMISAVDGGNFRAFHHMSSMT